MSLMYFLNDLELLLLLLLLLLLVLMVVVLVACDAHGNARMYSGFSSERLNERNRMLSRR